jgi:hypothetical protein
VDGTGRSARRPCPASRGGDGPAPRHDDLLTVRDRRGEVDELELRASCRAAGVRKRVSHASALRQPVEPGAPNRTDDVDDDPRGRGRGGRRRHDRRRNPHGSRRAGMKEHPPGENQQDERDETADHQLPATERDFGHVVNPDNENVTRL